MPYRSLLFAVVVVFIDQITKYFITLAIPYQAVVPVVPYFQLTYTINSGMAFSLFQGSNVWFILITCLAIAGFVWLYIRMYGHMSYYARVALKLIMGGAVGNVIDRIFQGGVVDFLDFYVGSYHWPAFNLADSCISIGGVMLFVLIVLGKEKQ